MKNSLQIQGVIFDWDNTLVNTLPTILKALNCMADDLNMPHITMEYLTSRPHLSLRDTFPSVFGDRWKEAETRFYHHFQAYHLEMLEPMPGALEILQQLQLKNIPTAVVSNKKGHVLRLECNHLNWDHYFTAVIGSHDTSHDKPHPAPTQAALKTMDLAASSRIFFIGDSSVDVASAANLDLSAIFIGTDQQLALAKEEKADLIHHPDLFQTSLFFNTPDYCKD